MSGLEVTSTEGRPVRYRKYKYLFLIVCEDENTERMYFENFQKLIPKETLFLKAVGTGRDPKGVVEQSRKERDQLALMFKRGVDKVWAVFDKDDADENAAKIKRFNDAFSIAKGNEVYTGYSNEVFELWLLLHLTDIDSTIPLPRKEVYRLLEQNVRRHKGYADFEYHHGKSSILDAVATIGSQDKAFVRAQALLKKQHDVAPIDANPSTHVHLLVKDLLDWIAYFSPME